MFRIRYATRSWGWCLLLCGLAGPALASDLGSVEFPTSGSPEAQEAFLEGVLWLHSFEYDDAREHFQRARELEPSFVMAAWGEAMTYNYPIWMSQDREPAVEALNRLAATREERLALAPTSRERRYLEAVEILFGEGEKEERDLAYSEAMKALSEAHPGDLEAASLYALSLLGTCHEGRDVATYMRAAAVVEEVFAKNPRHPGAAHYLIHSYDDPVHAPLGLRAARVYAGIAPAAEHALHMPSHIFLALGMWQETVASNIDSFNAAEARVKRRGQSSERRGYHAMLWLHYAYLQQGRLPQADALLSSIQADLETNDSERTRRHYAQMRAHDLVETERWDTQRPSPDLEGLWQSVIAADHFVAGYGALRQGRLEAASNALAALEGMEGEAGDDGADAEVAVARLQLSGLIALAGGREQEGLDHLLRAAKREEETPFGYGPPLPVKPAHELLGEVLAELGQPEAAAGHFEQALKRAPRRARSLRGLAGALCAAEGREAARDVLEVLAEVSRVVEVDDHAWPAACGSPPAPSGSAS